MLSTVPPTPPMPRHTRFQRLQLPSSASVQPGQPREASRLRQCRASRVPGSRTEFRLEATRHPRATPHEKTRQTEQPPKPLPHSGARVRELAFPVRPRGSQEVPVRRENRSYLTRLAKMESRSIACDSLRLRHFCVSPRRQQFHQYPQDEQRQKRQACRYKRAFARHQGHLVGRVAKKTFREELTAYHH